MTLPAKGIDCRQTGSGVFFDAFLQDSAGSRVTTGTTNLYVYEPLSSGNLRSYDWNTGTFKTTGLTTEVVPMVHQVGNNGATQTGLWTYVLNPASGLTSGGIYYYMVENSGASPSSQMRKFQYGGAEGDLQVTDGATGTAYLQADPTYVGGSAAAGAAFKRGLLGVVVGTVGGSATTTSIPTVSLTPAAGATDQFKGKILTFSQETTTANLRGQSTDITASTAGGTLTVTALTTAPASGDVFALS